MTKQSVIPGKRIATLTLAMTENVNGQSGTISPYEINYYKKRNDTYGRSLQ